MKRFLFVGPQSAGKTSLICSLLENRYRAGNLPPTQDICLRGRYYIDTPGIFIEQAGFYSHISVLSQQADYVVMVFPADIKLMPVSEGFDQLLIRPLLGVVTKADLGEEQAAFAEELLRKAGAQGNIHHVCSNKDEDTDKFRIWIENI